MEKKISEFLVFKLGKEEYGVAIEKIQEIRSYEKPTMIASSPPFVKGIINLRGLIVPILDLRMKFNLSECNYNEFTVVIVLSYNGKTTGVVADSVCDVISVTEDSIKDINNIHQIGSTDYLIGMAMLDERLIQIIDIEKFLIDGSTLESENFHKENAQLAA